MTYAPGYYRYTDSTNAPYYSLYDDVEKLKDYTWTVYRATRQTTRQSYNEQIGSFAAIGTISTWAELQDTVNYTPNGSTTTTTKDLTYAYKGTLTDTVKDTADVFGYAYFAVGTKDGYDTIYTEVVSVNIGN
mgnify:CR=1 FL=1